MARWSAGREENTGVFFKVTIFFTQISMILMAAHLKTEQAITNNDNKSYFMTTSGRF